MASHKPSTTTASLDAKQSLEREITSHLASIDQVIDHAIHYRGKYAYLLVQFKSTGDMIPLCRLVWNGHYRWSLISNDETSPGTRNFVQLIDYYLKLFGVT